jgi:TatD DNase family protein
LGFHPEALGDPQLLAQQGQQLALFNAQLLTARYVGEVGLDGSPARKQIWSEQLAVLQHIATQCEQTDNKVLTVHSRRAVAEVLDLLASKRMVAQNNRLILHWFSGSARELAAAAAGAYFLVNHRMLRSAKGQQAVASMPQNRVLTETDAPFTLDTDIQSREQSLTETVHQLATIWRLSHEQARTLVWENFKRVLTNR